MHRSRHLASLLYILFSTGLWVPRDARDNSVSRTLCAHPLFSSRRCLPPCPFWLTSLTPRVLLSESLIRPRTWFFAAGEHRIRVSTCCVPVIQFVQLCVNMIVTLHEQSYPICVSSPREPSRGGSANPARTLMQVTHSTANCPERRVSMPVNKILPPVSALQQPLPPPISPAAST
jgi:hypothetical protein